MIPLHFARPSITTPTHTRSSEQVLYLVRYRLETLDMAQAELGQFAPTVLGEAKLLALARIPVWGDIVIAENRWCKVQRCVLVSPGTVHDICAYIYLKEETPEPWLGAEAYQ
jgi:hypothetical protein